MGKSPSSVLQADIPHVVGFYSTTPNTRPKALLQYVVALRIDHRAAIWLLNRRVWNVFSR